MRLRDCRPCHYGLEKTDHLNDPYVVTGNRLYAIGIQHGTFPDIGSHVPGEMGGVWDHPIKLLDGFWFALETTPLGEEQPQQSVHADEAGISHHLSASSDAIASVNVLSPSPVTRPWLTRAERFCACPGLVEFTYVIGPIKVTRREFVPDDLEGLVIELIIYNPTPKYYRLRVTFLARTDLRPVWLSERLGLNDAPDQIRYDPNLLAFIAWDTANPWYVVFGGDKEPTEHAAGGDLWGPECTAGQGTSGMLTYSIPLRPGETVTLPFFIAGSCRAQEEAINTLRRLRDERSYLFSLKEHLYTEIAATCCLSSPDPLLDEAFMWAKYCFQMLARKVPGLGEGIGAGLPEYPWWFSCDSAYAVPAAVASGFHELAKETLRLLAKVSQNTNSNGRIVHEVVTNSVVYNPGNLVETPLFVRALYHTYRWTGDSDLLRELYPLCKQGMLEYVLGECDPDGDLCGAGRSIVETKEMAWGLESLDVAAYTYEALTLLSEIASDAGDAPAALLYQEKAAELRRRINREWWLAGEGLYGDLRASPAQIQSMTANLKAYHQRDQHVQAACQILEKQLATVSTAHDAWCRDRPWLLYHWIGVTPLEVGAADLVRANRALDRLESADFCGEWGLYLNGLWNHTVMSLPAGVLAVAEAHYGRMERAMEHVHRIASTLRIRFPGGISEALPDKWCFLQAWSGYGIIWPVIKGILGLNPDAAHFRVTWSPRLPARWDGLILRRVRIGQAWFDFTVWRDGSQLRAAANSTDPFYQVILVTDPSRPTGIPKGLSPSR